MSLNPDEQRTVESYEKSATLRAATAANWSYWTDAAEAMKRHLAFGRLIDIGCGIGKDYVLLSRLGFDYAGIDASKKLIREARKLWPGGDFKVMSFYDLDFPSDSFDGFWSVLSFLHADNLPLALSEAKRVVKPEGIGLIVMRGGEGSKRVEYDGTVRKYNLFDLEGFAGILEHNGLSVLDSGFDKRGENAWSTGYLQYVVRNVK